MSAFKVPRLPRRRTLAVAIAAGVAGSFLVTAAPSPASAQVVTCNPPHTNNWAKIYGDYDNWNSHILPQSCIGFVSDNPVNNLAQVFCSGNNQGFVTYDDLATGTFATHTFWPGGVYEVRNGTYTQSVGPTSDLIVITDVDIAGYSTGNVTNC